MGDIAAYMLAAVPISAIVMGVGSDIFKRWTQHQEEMARIKASTANGTTSSSEIEILRVEIAKLRDTTTQYDMSVEHALQELTQRVASLESKNRGEYVAPKLQSVETPQELRHGN